MAVQAAGQPRQSRQQGSLGSLGSKAALAVWHLDSVTVGQTRSVVVHPRSMRGTGPQILGSNIHRKNKKSSGVPLGS